MFSYRKKVLQKKIVAISILIGIITITIFSIVGYIQKQVNAITEEGDPIVVNYTRDIYYGERDNGEPYRTRDFTVSIGNQIVTSFCANPKRRAVKGTFPAVIMQDTDINKRIKLMIYIATANNNITNPIMDSFFSGVNNSDLRYAYSHAVIGALYDNDYHALTTSEEAMIRAIYDPGLGNDRLGDLIDENNDAWLIAKNYQLYTIDRSGTEYAGDRYQDIVWIEPNYQYGNIKVIKRDSNTQSSTPQGSASLQGITFKVYNNGGRFYNSTNNTFYNNGDEIASGTTDANGEITFSNLPLGSYSVKETAANSSYELTSSAAQTTTLSTNGQTQTLTFDNTVKKGSISISKKDKELNSCDQLGKAKFTGIKFLIINNSANPVYYGGNSIAVGSVVTEKTLSATDCSASFEGLPYGQYQVKETGSGVGYLLDTTVHDVTIPSNNSTSLSVEFKNQVIRGDVKFKKVDQNGQAMANIPFRITSKTTGESHIVVTDTNGVVDTSSSINLHSNHTNGYDSISNFDTATYQSYGTWFGKSASNSSAASVNDSLGALPYDTYEIVEVSCKQNQFCYDIESEKQTFDIVSNDVTVDLGNWENDCAEFSLATTAVDNADEDKYIAADSEAQIKDTVSYCLKVGMEFTIKGILMDKTTGEVLKNADDEDIEQSTTVTPTTDCGEVVITFDVDTTLLPGHDIVVFENAYYEDELVATHADIDDSAQTISVIDLTTFASDSNNENESKDVVASGIVRIKDAVKYCLKANTEFTIKGVLMNKDTGKQLLVNDEPVEQEVIFTPEETCGELEMFYEFDATGLGGTSVVIFENVYQGEDLIIEHKDLDNEDETFYLLAPAPDTGYLTGSSNGANQSSSVILIISVTFIVTSSYFGIKLRTRKKFLNRF